MTDLVIPPALDQARVAFRYVDPSGSSTSRYNGATQTTSYGGDRVAASIDFSPCGGGSSTGASRRAQLKAFLMALRGQQGRCYLTDVSSPLRGGLAASELLSNTEFASTTGFAAGDDATLSVRDAVLRVTRSANSGTGLAFAYATIASTPAFVPIGHRFICADVAGTTSVRATLGGAFNYVTGDGGSNVGYRWALGYTNGASGNVHYDNVGALASKAGERFDVSWASVARCLVVDGSPNSILQSHSLATTWTKVGLTAPSGNDTDRAPDGTTTAETLTEDTSTGGHYLTQNVTVSASVADLQFTVSLKKSSSTWAFVQMNENTGATAVFAYVDLWNGTFGTVGAGANWAGLRKYITPRGDDWYEVTIIAIKTNAATSISCLFGLATGDSGGTYTGASLSIAAYGASFNGSAWPTRVRPTTTTAVTAETQTGAAGIYVKGGRTESEGALAGALVKGDWIEVDGQICMVVAPLDLDASGRGYLQVSPPPRRPLSDNTPIFVHKPMGRFMYTGRDLGWANEPGLISSAQIELQQAFSA